MSDERLRELERRWKESGASEDELAWFQERLRVGDLDSDKLGLAAFCNHAAATQLVPQLGWAARAGGWVREALLGKRLLPGLRPWGKEACVRGMIAAGRLVVPICAEHLPDPRPADAVLAAEDWVLDQSEANRRRAAEAAEAAYESYAWFGGSGVQAPPNHAAEPPEYFGSDQLAAIVSCIAPAEAIGGDMNMNAEGAAVVALQFFRGGKSADLLEEVQQAIRGEIIKWALHDDPIRLRRSANGIDP